MRRLLSTIVPAVMIVLIPMLAKAGNQEVADQIANSLRSSGKMNDYRIAVKFQDGTATLKGRVASQAQMNTALKSVYKTPGVSRVVNELTVSKSATQSGAQATNAAYNGSSSNRRSYVQQTSVTEPATLQQHRLAYNQPRPMAGTAAMPVAMQQEMGGVPGAPQPMYSAASQGGAAPVRYDQACMPNYAWPSYAAYPNYAAVTYPRQYSPTAWPYIGPFYPYPQVPLGWRKVTLEWKDGWWFLDFKDDTPSCWRR
jgi:hypothetical protein